MEDRRIKVWSQFKQKAQEPTWKTNLKKESKRTRDVGQLVEHLPSKHKILSSISNTGKKKKKIRKISALLKDFLRICPVPSIMWRTVERCHIWPLPDHWNCLSSSWSSPPPKLWEINVCCLSASESMVFAVAHLSNELRYSIILSVRFSPTRITDTSRLSSPPRCLLTVAL
jgi:hypothetical protein